MRNPLRIIVASDDPELLRYYQRMIPELGHTVVASVQDRKQLLDTCKELGPDVIITDVNLRGNEGLADVAGCELPFIILSADDEPNWEMSALRSRMIAYLQKPIGREELSRSLQSAVARVTQRDLLRSQFGVQ